MFNTLPIRVIRGKKCRLNDGWPHDVVLGAADDGEEFALGIGRHVEFVQRLLKIVQERLPFLFRDR